MWVGAEKRSHLVSVCLCRNEAPSTLRSEHQAKVPAPQHLAASPATSTLSFSLINCVGFQVTYYQSPRPPDSTGPPSSSPSSPQSRCKWQVSVDHWPPSTEIPNAGCACPAPPPCSLPTTGCLGSLSRPGKTRANQPTRGPNPWPRRPRQPQQPCMSPAGLATDSGADQREDKAIT